MFTFNDLVGLPDKEIRIVLQEVEDKDLAIALKAASEELKERIFSNVSKRVADTIREEMEFTGPIRKSEVEEIQLKIVQTVRELEAAGQMTIVRGDAGDDYVV